MSAGHTTAEDELLAVAGQRRRLAGTRSAAQMDLARLVALIPLLVLWLTAGGQPAAMRLVVALAVTLAWQLIFARFRKRRMQLDGLATAGVLVLLLPTEASLGQIALAASFGIVLGELIFGGRGWSFISAPVAALAFLYFSYPEAGTDTASLPALGVLAGFALLWALGLVTAVVPYAGALVLGGAMLLNGSADAPAWLDQTHLLIALAFLAADPVTAAATRAGRWLHGGLIGLLLALLPSAGAFPDARTTVFALLLAGIFVPLIDALLIRAIHWRRHRHG